MLVADTGPAAGVAWDKITHARGQDIGAWSLMLRNAAGTGVRDDVKISALTEEASPDALDWLVGELASGELRKFDVGLLPGGLGNIVTDTIWDVLGDLAVGTGADTAARLAIGAADTVLVRTAGATAGWEKVTNARMANMSADHLIGRITGGAGVREEFQIQELTERAPPQIDDWLMGSDVSGVLLKFDVELFQIKSDGIWNAKGDLAVGSAIDTAGIRSVGVTDGQALRADSVDPTGLSYGKLDYADLQPVSATDRLLGRDTAGSGDIEEIAPAAARTMLSLVVGTDFQKSISKSITVENPTNSEVLDLWFTDVPITVAAVQGVLSSGTTSPSVTLSILHNTDRSLAGNQAVNNQIVTSITTGDNLTLGGDPTVPASSWLWLETIAQGGTVPRLALTIRYTED